MMKRWLKAFFKVYTLPSKIVTFFICILFLLQPICVKCDEVPNDEIIYMDEAWEYANMTAIHNDPAILYTAKANRKNIVVALDAGHGTTGAAKIKLYCHPDGSRKTTSGSTDAGITMVNAQSVGMEFKNGKTEREVALKVAQLLKEKLLNNGYDVLMLRTKDKVELDLLARTIIANNRADCHISLHYDGDEFTYNKGAYYISVPKSIKNMPPVDRMWQLDDYLGQCLIDGLKTNNVKIFSKGSLAVDLMQTSYSTIPSVDMELGNEWSNTDYNSLNQIADGLLIGINRFFNY